ncbi:uncharacterized protein LOC112047571 isoform X2 [Bicyclus anynana]|uniref:Uncharacterized protein LOC112047571 isoform X2 n=1 Tax=Bicyclus anynana TaxID=110368 RepID=A0ABM3LT10_BICAN|nr:uncharacterized protein LOC112047571 isoform X2 [Bicyclus anynana]
MIILIWTIYFTTGAICFEEKQNVQYGTNVTTLYPVKNIFNDINKNETRNGREGSTLLETNSSKEFDRSTSEEDMKTTQCENGNGTDSNNKNVDKEKSKVQKIDMANWKIDSFFTPAKQERQQNISAENKTNSDIRSLDSAVKEFKPSPQLGNFFSEDAFVVPTEETISSFSPMSNPSLYFGSPGDFYKLNYKPPITYADQIDTPYKFENTVPSRAKDSKYSSRIEPKGNVEAPAKIPAGGLYKLPDPFKEKPSTDSDDDDFGLDFNDEEKNTKENPVKKRGNPWKGLLHLATALLPIGIILSALTPNIITLDNTDNDNRYPNRYSRRAGVVHPPSVSEACRRRLLCELHSEANYSKRLSGRKQCYKIHCDEPQALSRVLSWLLQHNREHGRPPQDRRGYIT